MKTIELKDKIVGFVEVPMSSFNHKVTDMTFHCKNNDYDDTHTFVKMPSSGWQILSLHNEMTEEKAKIIMPSVHIHPHGELFMAYCSSGAFSYNIGVLESYHSLVKSLGLVTENPYGAKPKNSETYNSHHEFISARLDWQEAQKIVKNYIVIYKEKYQCQI